MHVCVELAFGFSRFLRVNANLGITFRLTKYWHQLSLPKATHRVKFGDRT
jgi:hypothetical protein